MSCIQNEEILENIWEELIAELTETETLPLYSEQELHDLTIKRFEDLCQ